MGKAAMHRRTPKSRKLRHVDIDVLAVVLPRQEEQEIVAAGIWARAEFDGVDHGAGVQPPEILSSPHHPAVKRAMVAVTRLTEGRNTRSSKPW